MENKKTSIVSIFSSIQGEGLYLGKLHLFIRFTGCNLRCYYCDTPEALVKTKYCMVETAPFSKTSYKTINPIDNESLFIKIKQSIKIFPYYHSIVLTGGEPLLHTPFIKSFLPAARKFKIPIMLETNGTLPEQLENVLNLIDIISMDIKIPSDTQSKQNTSKIWESTEEFLKISLRNKRTGITQSTYIKIILTNTSKIKDYQKACQIIARINKHAQVILQPVSSSPSHKNIKTPSFEQIIDISNIFAKTLDNIKIIPQVHRLMKWK
jgi:7-carboxy-7-deazaguanine synthase